MFEYSSSPGRTVPPSIRIYPYLIRNRARKDGIRRKRYNMHFSHVVKMADSECASCASPSRSLSSSTHSESVASASDSEHESTSYASSSLGHLQPPPRNKRQIHGTGKSKSSWSFRHGLKQINTEIGYKNTEIRLCAY